MNILNYKSNSKGLMRQLGLIVLQSDITIEDEFRYFFDDLPVSLLVNRIPFENNVTVETLQAMQGHVKSTMSLFPIDTEFDVMAYGCTSGALHIGDEVISSLIQETRPSKQVTNPMLAAITAFKALGVNKIAYLAPYSELVSQSMVDEIEKRGITVATAATFNELQDKEVGRISPESIKQASIALAEETDVDAIFVSCTNMKCAQVIPQIEAQTGVPTLSSNQALAWHMLKLSGCAMPTGKGKLFTCH